MLGPILIWRLMNQPAGPQGPSMDLTSKATSWDLQAAGSPERLPDRPCLIHPETRGCFWCVTIVTFLFPNQNKGLELFCVRCVFVLLFFYTSHNSSSLV